MMMLDWIVYELCYPEGEPFYVGKGRRHRPAVHLSLARNGNCSHRSSVIRKIEREGNVVGVEIAFETDDEAEAFVEEIRLIAHYRRAGVPLTNKTDGGEGASGYKRTPEQRRLHTEDEKRRISASLHQHYADPMNREKLSVAQRGRIVSDETRRKIGARFKGQRLSAEHRKKLSDAKRGKKISVEHQAALRAGHQAYWTAKKVSDDAG